MCRKGLGQRWKILIATQEEGHGLQERAVNPTRSSNEKEDMSSENNFRPQRDDYRRVQCNSLWLHTRIINHMQRRKFRRRRRGERKTSDPVSQQEFLTIKMIVQRPYRKHRNRDPAEINYMKRNICGVLLVLVVRNPKPKKQKATPRTKTPVE
jgi:hypothetical protein